MLRTFVFDTNCLISAHLLPGSTPRKAYDLAMNCGVLVHSIETLSEFSVTFLNSKFDKYITSTSRQLAISQFENKSFPIEPTVRIYECRDPKDNKFLELALSCEADCIVSGDKDLLVLHPFQGVSILSPADFIQAFQ